MALLPFVLVALQLAAQPGWGELEFSFVLEHHGVEVPAEKLERGGGYTFELEGERVRPFIYNTSRFSVVRFPADRSDITMHRDTLWLRIRHRTEGEMAIGFPPRWGLQYHELYGTEHIAVDFAPGRVLVTELPKLLRVTGVMEGLGRPWQNSPTYELAARCGCDTVLDVATGLRNAMDFDVRCRTRLRDGREEAELVFFTRSGPFQPYLQMMVRGAAGGHWPLDTVPFVPTRFVINSGGQPITPDDEGPRDLVLGMGARSTWSRISPVNPRAGDTVRFTLQWLGGAELLNVSHNLVQLVNDTTTLELTIQREPIGKDRWAMFRLKAVTHDVPALAPGVYRLRLVYANEEVWHVPHFPEAEGYVFRVGP